MPNINSYPWVSNGDLVMCYAHDGASFYELNENYVVFRYGDDFSIAPLQLALIRNLEDWPVYNGLTGRWVKSNTPTPDIILEKLGMLEEAHNYQPNERVFLRAPYPGPLFVYEKQGRECVLVWDGQGSTYVTNVSKLGYEPFHGCSEGEIAIRKPLPWSWGAVCVGQRDIESCRGRDDWEIYPADAPHTDPVLRDLGLTMGVSRWYLEDYDHYILGSRNNLRPWMNQKVWDVFHEKAVEKARGDYPNMDFDRRDLELPFSYITFITRLQVFLPTHSTITPGHISIYESPQKMKEDRKTSMKPGRALRKMFPELTDAMLEQVVNCFRVDYPNHNYEVVVSKEREDFGLAYNGKMAAYQHIHTTRNRKSLANSCMRGGGAKDWEHLECHPGEAYASGDFTVVYARVKAAGDQYLIGGRCVVATCFDPPRCAPIYGVDEASIDVIQNELDKMGAADGDRAGWGGAKMLRIPHRGSDEDFVLPYLDVGPCAIRSEDFTISRDGDLDCSDYSGVISIGGHYRCCHCGDQLREEDAYHDPDGDIWCEPCYFEHYFHCEHFDEDMPIDERVTVHFLWRGRRREMDVSETALDQSGDYVYCEDHGEYWKIEDTVELRDGEYVPTTTADDECSICALSGDWDYTNNMVLILDAVGEEVYAIEDEVTSNEEYYGVDGETYIYAHINNKEEEEVA